MSYIRGEVRHTDNMAPLLINPGDAPPLTGISAFTCKAAIVSMQTVPGL